MNIEKYTDRTRGFIQSAQSLATREGHQQFSPLHILKVLLDDSEELAGGLIDRAGGNSRAILKATEDALAKLPKVTGAGSGQIYPRPNIGAEYLVNQLEGEDTSAVREQVMALVRAHFRPEFLNRVDEIILFHRLQKSEMGRIVDIQFARLQKLLEDRKIELSLDSKARHWLAAKGWDPAYGARPLKRVIQRNVQDPLAEMILAGDVRDGSSVKLSAAKGASLSMAKGR